MLQVPGAKEVGVELYTLTKGHSMAGWRVGFLVGNPEIVAALGKLKSYLDYGTFQPIQIASIIALNEGDDYVDEVNEIYLRRRDVLVDGLNRGDGRSTSPGDDVRVGADPRSLRRHGIARLRLPPARRGQGGGQPGVGVRPVSGSRASSVSPWSRTSSASPPRRHRPPSGPFVTRSHHVCWLACTATTNGQ
jgi:alanine-synthesizing transaminase